MTFFEVTKTLFLAFFKFTFPIFAITLLASLPLGLIIAFASMSKHKWISRPMQVVVWIVRGIPLMLLVMIAYFGMALLGVSYSTDRVMDALIAVLIAFIINYSCYFAEIFRGGIESISKGQYEAGQVLGMTKTQVFFKVILLQVVKRILPAMSNEVMSLIKDTALANVTGTVVEVIQSAYQIMSVHAMVWPLFYTSVFYLAAVGIFTLLFKYAEKKLSYFKA